MYECFVKSPQCFSFCMSAVMEQQMRLQEKLRIISLLLRNVLHDLCNNLPLNIYIYMYIYIYTYTYFNLIHALFLTPLTHVDWRLLKFRHIS